ncbi:MAG: hypothetical protein WCD18_21015 [Thermosynechococcaceae cyanobacterium]
MTVIGVTGPRRLDLDQHQQVLREMKALILLANPRPELYVGDAKGVDAIARAFGEYTKMRLWRADVHSNLPLAARTAKRSEQMVRALATAGGTLHAWPNKPAPLDLRPSRNWPKHVERSGTWGTIAMAVGLGVPVVIHPLAEIAVVDWVQQKQLTLL